MFKFHMISVNFTNTTAVVDDIGGVKYVLMFLAEYVPYITFYIVGTIIGVLGESFFNSSLFFFNLS